MFFIQGLVNSSLGFVHTEPEDVPTETSKTDSEEKREREKRSKISKECRVTIKTAT